MTEQETIKYLKGGCLGLNCEYHIKDRCKDDYEVREKKKDDAINLSIMALEKQIAKKLHNYYCPICRYYFEDRESHKYCPECGQRLEE